MARSLSLQERGRFEKRRKCPTTEIVPCRTLPDGHLKTRSQGAEQGAPGAPEPPLRLSGPTRPSSHPAPPKGAQGE